MTVNEEQLNDEKKYLSKTISVINELIKEKNIDAQDKIKDIIDMKRYIWENNSELDDAEIASGMYAVNNDVDNTNEKIKELLKLKKSLLNPYFGRVDFKTDNDVMKVYVGTNSIIKDLDFYVFDWRSPIASLFYNYEKGEASYDAPAGKINGNIILKRQYKISNSKLERCFDSSINIDDDYLQEILANSSTEKMTNIVNTIQKEQNEIIRNVKDKYLIVQGIAGSGKTSVALHRIAYLLYKEKNLKSNNVLIFSPNDVFSEYISNVLPELGEDNVLQTTFTEFSSSYMKRYKRVETFTEFIERYYKDDNINEEEYNITKYKLSDEFKNDIDKYINNLLNEIEFKGNIKISSQIISKQELDELLHERFSRFPLTERFSKISEYICNLLNISYKKNGKILKDKLLVCVNKNLEPESIYMDILNNKEFKEKINISKNLLKFEDLLPLLYITFELNGYPKDNMIKHVIVDEAQDYSLLQFQMLKKIFCNSSFTILGDVNQTINPYYIYKNLNNINQIFDNKGTYIELLKTYRSSEEIIEFTNKILGLNNTCSVRRGNNIPVVFKDSDKEDILDEIKIDIEKMKSNGIKRIAIILKNNLEINDIYNGLKKRGINCSLITNKANNVINDIVILPSYISKGLEFDGVISYSSKDNPYKEKDKYLFYVACTRAQHSLTVYNQKRLVRKNK